MHCPLVQSFSLSSKLAAHTRTNGIGRVLVGELPAAVSNAHLPVMSEALSVSYAGIGLFQGLEKPLDLVL